MRNLPDEVKKILNEGLQLVKDSQDKLESQHKDIDGVVKKIQEDIDNNGKEYSETKERFQEYVEKANKTEETVAALKSDLEEMIRKANSMPGGANTTKSLGQVAVENEEAIKSYEGGNVTLCKFEGPLFRKDLLDTNTGAAVQTERQADRIIGLGQQALRVRDLLTVIPTVDSAIEYLRQTGFTNNAASQNGQGTAAPESEFAFAKASETVETIHHHTQIARQLLNDRNGLQAFIDQFMRYGLMLEEEDQILLGDGTNGNLNGLVTQATAYNTGLNVSGDKKIDMVRRAILQATLANYPVMGIVLNPTDWTDIELMKTTDNAYLFTNPQAGATPRLWGKPVVETNTMTAGDFLTGGFSMGATLWDREQTTVRLSEHHSDNFIKGLITLLVEERVALTVGRPEAFITGTLADTA